VNHTPLFEKLFVSIFKTTFIKNVGKSEPVTVCRRLKKEEVTFCNRLNTITCNEVKGGYKI
ncbi:MAG: hypothetical protein QM652_14330, partial [Legionella sp.]|uniref:hypothetical protein n=1 Tax=Legionella sp. TaxID=459 RepID=UPI0039E2B90A